VKAFSNLPFHTGACMESEQMRGRFTSLGSEIA